MIKKLFIIVTIFIFSTIFIIKPTSVFATTFRFSWHWPVITPITLIATATTNQLASTVVTPTPQVLAYTTNSVQTYIINQINQYRASFGLSPVQPGPQTCNFAAIRAQEIATDFSHDKFTQRVDDGTLPYTSWSKVTENLAETPNYQRVVLLWKNSPEHAENMRADTPYVCVVQYGNYYAYEGLKP